MDGWHLLYVHLSEFDAKSGHISKCNVTPPPFPSFQMVLIVSEFNSKWKMTTLTHIALDLLERLDEARRIGSLAQKLHLHNHTNAGWGQWYSLKGPERLCWSLSNEAIRDTCPSGQVVCFRKEEHCMIAEKCVCVRAYACFKDEYELTFSEEKERSCHWRSTRRCESWKCICVLY